MNSVFVDELTQQGKRRINKAKDNETVSLYQRLLEYRSIGISGLSAIVGSLSLCLMGYMLQANIQNTAIKFFDLVLVLICGAIVGVGLWLLKSFLAYSFWKGMSKKDYEENKLDEFLAIEGCSELAFGAVLPIFIIISIIFSPYFAGLTIGGGVFIKYFLMYWSYPILLEKPATLDKVLYLSCSIGCLVLIHGIITVLN